MTPAKRILIADDNQDAADTLAVLLDFLGYETRTAYNGQDAVAIAQEFKPCLVILDINMPLMDGYEAAKTLRRTEGNRVILIALTAISNREAKARAADAGFDIHLTKPVGGDELEGLLQQVLHA
ncbi:response regulator [Aquabacterium sp. J223]|uniref:response regulator n=1 Tax=Aquabacterium sp. J223 TaxID=2898431 RepID=UPI0021AD590A|nr:response regulator [Aquabacterium sp. J223]UUX96183.1 response regulator [Aquabacterium sp. J223]